MDTTTSTTTNLANASELHHRWSVLNHALALYHHHEKRLRSEEQAMLEAVVAACNACDTTGQLAALFLERNAAWLDFSRMRDANQAVRHAVHNPAHLQRVYGRYCTAQCQLDSALAPLRDAAMEAGGAVLQAVMQGRY